MGLFFYLAMKAPVLDVSEDRDFLVFTLPDLEMRRLFLFFACFYPGFVMNAPPVPGEFVEVCMGPLKQTENIF
jgi:hypothetical protein